MKNWMASILICTMLLFASCAQLKQLPTPIIKKTGSALWELYPDPEITNVYAGEKILFKITPKSGDVTSMSIKFGDGNRQELQCKQNISGGCSFFYASNTYNDEGAYIASLAIQGQEINKIKVDIVPKFKTELELKEEAITAMIKKLEGEFDAIIPVISGNKRPKLAFTSFHNANFEYSSDPLSIRTFVLIQKIIKAFANDKIQYSILEKTPQVLVRLAHESITDDPDKGKNYLDSLDYGLKTRYESPSVPFKYAIQMEGVDDRRSNQGYNVNAQNLRRQSGDERATQQTVATHKEAMKSSKTVSNRPLLYAKFSTADYLVAIGVVEEPRIHKSAPIYFDPDYEKAKIKRTAKAEINVRILDKDGTIKWIKDVKGEVSDEVFQEYVPEVKNDIWKQIPEKNNIKPSIPTSSDEMADTVINAIKKSPSLIQKAKEFLKLDKSKE